MGKPHARTGIDARFRPFGNLKTLENVGPLPHVFLYLSILVTVNIGAVGVFLITRNETKAGAIAVAITVAAATATLVYFITGSSRFLVALMILAGIAGVIAMHIVLGGYAWSGGWLAWSLTHVTIVALMFPRIVAASLVAIYIFVVVGFAFLEPWFQGLRDHPPDVAVPAVLAADTFGFNGVLLAAVVGTLLFLLGREQQRNLDLLRNVLPDTVANRLKATPGVIAEQFDESTVLFADLVGFTARTTEVTPDRLVDELNAIFSYFDGLIAELGVEKIKTIGDGYMAVAGVPTTRLDHVEVICDLALRMRAGMSDLGELLAARFALHLGIATGPVVAGVIGTTRFSYDLWGHTVNVASRLQRGAEPGQILVNHGVQVRAGHLFDFRPIPELEVKGNAKIRAYELEGRKPVTEVVPVPVDADDR